MSTSTSGRTWDEASAPGATRLARRFENDWRTSTSSRRPDPRDYLPEESGSCPGARLALLRAEMNLRAEYGESFRVEDFRKRHPDLSAETLVALLYEEFCLREEAGETPDLDEYESRFPDLAAPLRRVFDIHGLIGSSPESFLESPPAAGPIALPEAGQTIAGFRLVDEIGRGAFARVFLAEERQLADRPVALKVARNGSREPSTLARLQHTHIVPIYSYRTDPATNLHLLCMPYLGGVTLAELFADKTARASRTGRDLLDALDRLEPSPGVRPGGESGRQALQGRSYVRAIAWWGARLAEALDHAHERGVLHRDVKPSNILVTSDGLPMLLDFNLAWETRLDDPTIEPGALGGTLAYMAPEHLEALADGVTGSVDARADIYALGVVLYEAMGSRPFPSPTSSGSLSATFLKAADDRRIYVPSLSEEHPEIPVEFDAVVSRCLAPDPARRYQSAADLAADLQAIADDLPLRNTRIPLAWRLSGWFRRHRGPLAASATAAFVAVMLGVMGLSIHFERQDRLFVVNSQLTEGDLLVKSGDFSTAMHKFETAATLSDGWRCEELVERYAIARERYRLAEETLKVRDHADQVFAQAENLRYALLGIYSRPSDAFDDTRRTLNIFYVLKSPTRWTDLPEMRLLDDDRRTRLVATVDDLLYLWTVARFFPNGRNARPSESPPPDRASILAICDRAIAFSPEPGPWHALKHWVERPEGLKPLRDGEDEPKRADVHSSIACFHWASLRMLEKRPADALAWLERAARLDANNYWVQYYLSYVHAYQRKDSLAALAHIEAAIALRPHSPSARFERAKLEFSRGNWARALDDLEVCLRMTETDESSRVSSDDSRRPTLSIRLMLGDLHQAIGDVVSARLDYDTVMAETKLKDPLFAVAVLNLAKLDADAGGTRRALDRYDLLLRRNSRDRDARRGRAMIALRMGDAARADNDLTVLLKDAPHDPGLLALHARVALGLGQIEDARRAAEVALRLQPNPSHQRLLARILLAGGPLETLVISDPGDFTTLPGSEGSLHQDLLRIAEGPAPTTFDGRLQDAVILSALGRQSEAESEMSRLVSERPSSSVAHLVFAQILCHARQWERASSEVNAALALESNDSRLWLLQGRILTELGRLGASRGSLDRAIATGAGAKAYAERARMWMQSGLLRQAIGDWNRAVDLDPGSPAFYIGRASCLRQLGSPLDACAELQYAADCAEDHPAAWKAIVAEARLAVASNPLRLPLLMVYANRLRQPAD